MTFKMFCGHVPFAVCIIMSSQGTKNVDFTNTELVLKGEISTRSCAHFFFLLLLKHGNSWKKSTIFENSELSGMCETIVVSKKN